MMLTEKQRGVLLGMMLGLACSLLALALAIATAPSAFLPRDDSTASAIAHALRWDLLPVLWLAANIAMLARHRFFTPADIDGGGLSDGTPTAKVLQAVLQNSLEQAVLAISAHLIWAATMPARWLAAIPAAAILFFIGRVMFWRGYARGAPARALGFALTFYPTIALLVVAVGHIVWSMAAYRLQSV